MSGWMGAVLAGWFAAWDPHGEDTLPPVSERAAVDTGDTAGGTAGDTAGGSDTSDTADTDTADTDTADTDTADTDTADTADTDTAGDTGAETDSGTPDTGEGPVYTAAELAGEEGGCSCGNDGAPRFALLALPLLLARRRRKRSPDLG